MLAMMIRAYRRSSFVAGMVRLMVAIHHTLVPASRAPCTLADCSGTGLAEASELGWKALPGILSRIGACGPDTSAFIGNEPCQVIRHRRSPQWGDSEPCMGISKQWGRHTTPCVMYQALLLGSKPPHQFGSRSRWADHSNGSC